MRKKHFQVNESFFFSLLLFHDVHFLFFHTSLFFCHDTWVHKMQYIILCYGITVIILDRIQQRQEKEEWNQRAMETEDGEDVKFYDVASSEGWFLVGGFYDLHDLLRRYEKKPILSLYPLSIFFLLLQIS